jgi:RHS repeat-associated protein
VHKLSPHTEDLARTHSSVEHDRKNVMQGNQVTSLTYDPLNRLKLVGYKTVVNAGVTSYESTVGYTYDAGNRITQAVDSAGGTLTEAYDNLDRQTTETTPQGSVTYGYDSAGRRASMTVAGQPQVSYTFDNGNRLTQIAQGTTNVGFTYDNDNRRSSLTLPNGVSVAYTFDSNSRVTGITYNFGANTLGNLTYSYDQLGRRTQVGGSFARTGLPGAVTTASYDAANELTNWNGTAISYDANGNMLSDGTNTFTWNGRDQVATLNSVGLQYDALGRRIKNTAGTSFLFDGVNATQELFGSTITANIWTGGLDELFQRSDSNGTVVPLTDVLGSTIALVDSSGHIQTTYSYDPFGNTTTAGAASSNPSQYTGRENEGNGLYFYRNRYYSPVLHRFVSEDPDLDGLNFYAYASNTPTNATDPTGLKTYVVIFYDKGGDWLGQHSALLVDNNGHPVLYDPGGDFRYPGESHPSDDTFYDEEAVMGPYIADDLHKGQGVDIIPFDTTPQQEADLVNAIRNQGSVLPGKCTVAVSHVLQTIEPFKKLPTFWRPVALERELKRIKTEMEQPPSPITRRPLSPYEIYVLTHQ